MQHQQMSEDGVSLPQGFTFTPIEPQRSLKGDAMREAIQLQARAGGDQDMNVMAPLPMRTMSGKELATAHSTADIPLQGTIPATVSYQGPAPEITVAPSEYSGSAAESIDPGTARASGRAPPAIIIPAGNASLAARSPSRTPKKTPRNRTPTGSAVIDIGVSPSRPRHVATPTRELDRFHVEARAPGRFICPISGRVMRDPVILPTGTTCDRGAFERYLAKGKGLRDPVTQRALKKPVNLTPNLELRNAITTWAKRCATWLIDEDGCLKAKEPSKKELLGKDPQYATPVDDDGNGGAGKSLRDSWKFVDRSKSSSRGVDLNANAAGGAPDAGSELPWNSHRGIAPAPKQYRTGSSIAGSRSSIRRRSSRSPSKRSKPARKDYASLIFLGLISAVYTTMFVVSLWKSDWELAPMVENPWYGPSIAGLTSAGAQALPLLEGAGQWWRLFSSPFLPAGIIHAALCLSGLWVYGLYARKSLPKPGVSLPSVYFLSSILGSMASANLDAEYLTCGAAAGVAGLLGVLCIDQMLHWRQKKLLNLREWWLTALILFINVGVYITFSLLPLVDVWATAAGLLTGILGGFVLLTLPNVGKGRPNTTSWAAGQIICALLLIGGATVAAVGLVMPTKLGESQAVLKDASCVEFDPKMWRCTPYGYLPGVEGGCGVETTSNSTTIMCPNATAPLPISPVSYIEMSDTALLKQLCNNYCTSTSTTPTTPPADATPTPPAGVVSGDAGVPPAPPAPSSPTPIGGNTVGPVLVELVDVNKELQSTIVGRKLRAGGARR